MIGAAIFLMGAFLAQTGISIMLLCFLVRSEKNYKDVRDLLTERDKEVMLLTEAVIKEDENEV